MAIVINKDGQGIKANGYSGQADRGYAVPTTAAAGVPATASLYASQIQLNSTTGQCYRALETGTTTWIEVHGGINAA